VKAPGVLHRISFLVIANSLFIFATVLLVGMQNNQAKIDRLIQYRFDFVSRYFRAELEDHRQAFISRAEPFVSDNVVLSEIFQHARRSITGLGSLALLTAADSGGYAVRAAAFRESVDTYDPQLWDRIVNGADAYNIRAHGVYVGPRFTTRSGDLKTVYIPVDAADPHEVLAITFVPDEIIGSDANYTWTIVLLFFVITLITLLIINLLFRKFVRPLQHLVQGMEKTAGGEVLYKIEGVTRGEMGRVASSFNAMSSALWEKRRQLTLSNQNLTLLNQRLTETLGELSGTNAHLSESRAFLSKLIENAPFAVIATGVDRKILVFSKAATEMFDIRVDQALGRDLDEFFPFSPDKLFPQPGEKQLTREEEMICRKPNGDSFPALVTRVSIREGGADASAHLFIIRDISESRGFQEMMISIDRMATRGVMAGEIAHEINNYLAIILGNVELLPLLLAKGKTDKVDQKLELLRATVGKIQRFSEGLMGYGNEEAVFEPGDLNQLIENLIAFLRPQNRYDGIRFEFSLSPKLPLVEFDSAQMQQLLVNLLNNAADALREKPNGRCIEIATHLMAEAEKVQIVIADTACGLPDDLRDVIFKDRYTGQRRGRGFGLVIVKRIIDKHAGSIEYDSRSTEGTTFTITLPIRAKTAAEPVSENEARQVPS
jgi:PAS domain S-box-containing protein